MAMVEKHNRKQRVNGITSVVDDPLKNCADYHHDQQNHSFNPSWFSENFVNCEGFQRSNPESDCTQISKSIPFLIH